MSTRKSILRELKQRERAEAEARMPISRDQLTGLFDHLDTALEQGCDHSLSHTRSYLQSHALPEESILPWLAEYGGYCDCEVLSNVGDSWE
jgi:hypothetical protein